MWVCEDKIEKGQVSSHTDGLVTLVDQERAAEGTGRGGERGSKKKGKMSHDVG